MKKLLCLTLILAVVVSSFSFCLTASAKGDFDITYRPDGKGEKEDIVGKIIDPIIADRKDSDFAASVNEIGYETIDKLSGKLTKENFNTFITANADDSMLGVDYDLLYSKDKGAYFWSFIYKDLAVDFSGENLEFEDKVINSVIANTGSNKTAADFRAEWARIRGNSEFTIHDVEIYAASVSGKKTTCTKKGDYDACSEVLNGYVYDYKQKATDLDVFNDIVETRVVIRNPYTNKDEVHYNYSYDLTKGNFSLMRANDNKQIINTICSTWKTETLYKNKEVANANAIKIANFIGNLLYADFKELQPGTRVFTDNNITEDYFFQRITEVSGLKRVLQDYWCNASSFDVKAVMYAFGVNVDDKVILNVELEKGEHMGSRILADIFREFYRNPVTYVESLIQIFGKSYSYTYKKAFQSLFTLKYPSMSSKSVSANYPELDRYDGSELDTLDGLINFITDCIYVSRVDIETDNAEEDGVITAEEQAAINAAASKKFSFAPLPINRIVNASDADEFHLYFLCYLDINRKYEDNAAMIEEFINKIMVNLEEDYKGEGKLEETEKVLRAIFNGELTVIDILTFHAGTLTQNTLNSFDFASTIKNAIGSIFQKFVEAMDSLMNLLFGWTDGLFDKVEK